jgi:hypothetical protein
MGNLTIDLTVIEDMKASGHRSDAFEVAKRHLLSGGRVIIQREYVNAPPDVICECATIQQLESYLK